MKIWKHFSRRWYKSSFLWIVILYCSSPVPLSKGCGPAPYTFEGYSFLHPYIVNPRSDMAPFILDFGLIQKFYKGQRVVQQVGNLVEWQERFCDGPELEDLEYVIYKASVDEMRRLRTSIGSKSIPLDYRLEKNTFAQYLDRNKCFETIDYLIFAKRCEPYVVRPQAWGKGKLPVNNMQRLIDLGKRVFMRTESHYIKLRYAYQLIRLAHYAQDYEQTLELYDFLMPKIDNAPSIIEDWILGHKAGAMMALGQNVEASYLYAKIFGKCPSKRESAFRSFKIKTDEEWHQCLLLCEDNPERANLYVLRANGENAIILEELKKIYDLDPKNENLEFLMVKEIQKLEKDLLGTEFNDHRRENKRFAKIPRPIAGSYIIDLQKFVRHLIDEKKVRRPDFWLIVEGYLELLAGNYYDAGKSFGTAQKLVKNDTLKQQLEVFELVLKISAMESVDETVETEIAKIKRTNKWFEIFEDFSDLIDDKLVYLYQQNGHPGKAFRSRYSLKELKPNPQMDILNDLLNICDKPRPNRLERDMVIQGDSTIKNDLLDIKATLFMSEYQFEAALEVYKEMDRVEWDNYGLFNPFEFRFKDCVNCKITDTLRLYNKGELIERLLELEYKAKATSDQNQAAYYNYLLGLGHYNMSYFSSSWKAMDYFRSGSSISSRNLKDGDNIIPHRYYPLGNKENFDCTRALFYFEKARVLATNLNLAAQASYMAAKCERNIYYFNRANGAPRTYEYFRLLQTLYSDSDFYKTEMGKCKEFAVYVAN